MDDYDDLPVFFGQGAARTLTDDGEPEPRLARMRSVRTLVSLRDPPKPKRPSMGFHIPRPRS